MHIEMQAGPTQSQQKNALTKPPSTGYDGSGKKGDHGDGRTALSIEDTEENAPLAKEEHSRPRHLNVTATLSGGDMTPEELHQQLGSQKEEPLDAESRSTMHELASQDPTFGDGTEGPGQGKADIFPELDQARSDMDSPNSVARLYLALESLTRTSSAAQAGKSSPSLDGAACVEFSAEWPKDGNLPAFLDPSCLQPAWSVAEEQVGVSVELMLLSRRRGWGGGTPRGSCLGASLR